MSETIRMNLNVDPDVPVLLAELAGSQRKMGEYLTNMIRTAHAAQMNAGKPGDLEMIANATRYLSAKVQELEARVSQLEARTQPTHTKGANQS